LFVLDVTGRDTSRIDPIDGTEVTVVGAPVRNFGVEELLEGGRHPGGGVDSVGDGVHLVLREHELGYLAVLHGHSIDIAGEAESKVGHVEETIVKTACSFDGGSALGSEDLVHLIETELVVPGGDRSMGGEDASLSHVCAIGVGGLAERAVAESLFKKADGKQRGVAFVHVIDLGLGAEGLKESDTAEAENGLLTETIEGVAAVEVIGELAVPGVVAFDVAIEEEDGDDMAGSSDYVIAPGLKVKLAALDIERKGRPCWRKFIWVPGNVSFGLLPHV
jgi:hypothetical protein